jgi:hypothetical protein
VFVDKQGPDPGPALLLLGALALLRSWSATAPPPAAWEAGATVALRVEELRGEEFRLLPGVGPALAARLEAARATAGRLDPLVPHVSGVGPALRAKWAALRPADTSPSGGTSPPGAGLR